MKCRIVELYRGGERLDRAAAMASMPLEGELTIYDNMHPNSSGRGIRMADLLEVTMSWQRPILPPLLDPAILRMKIGENGFVLRGFQIETTTVEGKPVVREHAQEWWVRPA